MIKLIHYDKQSQILLRNNGTRVNDDYTEHGINEQPIRNLHSFLGEGDLERSGNYEDDQHHLQQQLHPPEDSLRMIGSLTKENKLMCQNFIQIQKQIWLNDNSNQYQLQPSKDTLTSTHSSVSATNPQGNIYPAYDDMPHAYSLLESTIQTLKEGQKRTYNDIVKWMRGDNELSDEDKQLSGFITGEGGTGKSRLIMCLREFCHLFFGKQEGQYGSVLCMAPTGAAASNINGYTWQSIVHTGMGAAEMKVTDSTAQLIEKQIKGVKLIILDEMSLISYTTLAIIEHRIIAGLVATCNGNDEEKRAIRNKRWGGIHFLGVGDLFQLGNMHTHTHPHIDTHTHTHKHKIYIDA